MHYIVHDTAQYWTVLYAVLTEALGVGSGPGGVLHTPSGEGALAQVLGEAVVLHYRVIDGALVHLVHAAVLHRTQRAAIHP